MPTSQSTRHLLMIRPNSFGYDAQTAVTNVFQHRPQSEAAAARARAQAEFDAYVGLLRSHGIEAIVFDDPPEPPKPNGVFPNNWLSTTPDGRIFLYPMATPSRRAERNPAVLAMLGQSFQVSAVRDLSDAESHDAFLESTGVMVFDHINAVVYACVSARCDEALLVAHAKELGYTPVIFRAYDQGLPVYHTNVMLGIQTTTAVICSAVISDKAERERVLSSLRATGRTIVDISAAQMEQYCGNVLEVQNHAGHRFLLLSASAYAAFTPSQLEVLGHDKALLPVALPTIEAIGGGSARCMVAEIFLPPKESAR